jgi:hypothetical protein
MTLSFPGSILIRRIVGVDRSKGAKKVFCDIVDTVARKCMQTIEVSRTRGIRRLIRKIAQPSQNLSTQPPSSWHA